MGLGDRRELAGFSDTHCCPILKSIMTICGMNSQ
jgi:hypothetical protein